MEVGPGDEVITQAFTCVAVPEGILAAGATPVFADIEPNGYNLDPYDLEMKITNRTRAIIVQHTFGIPSQIEQIIALADAHGVPVIEDCCHVFPSTGTKPTLGSLGAAAFYSFEWGKPLVAGLGGAAIVSDPSIADRLRQQYTNYHAPSLLRTLRIELQYHAFQFLYRPRWYWAVRSAFHRLSRAGAAEGNFNTVKKNEVSDDFGRRLAPHLRRRIQRKAKSIPQESQHRTEVVRQYRALLGDVEHPILPNNDLPLARYPVRVANKTEKLNEARENGIELADWYRTPIHPLTPSETPTVGYLPGACPQAEQRAEEIVSLPTHAGVDRRFIEQAASIFQSPPSSRQAA